MLYKYRSLQNFKNLVDIFVNNRMFAAPYFDLNDPMEGHYLYPSGEFDIKMQDLLASEKEKIRILSLSRQSDISLMWAHYADGNRGVAIGVELDEHVDVRPIRYEGLMTIKPNVLDTTVAMDVLTRKLPVWQYEQEERVFVRRDNFVHLSVKEVIIGGRMSPQDKKLVKNMVALINPRIVIKSQKSIGQIQT